MSGNKDAFSALFRRFYPLLFQYGNKILSDPAVVEDAVQELFLEIWQKPTAQPLHSVKAYLLQAVKFKLYKVFRNQKSRPTTAMPDDDVFVLSQETLQITAEEHNARTEKIYAALAQLSPRQREVIYLKVIKGLSYEEVSQIMGVNYQVVRNLLCAALKAFRKAFALLLTTAFALQLFG